MYGKLNYTKSCNKPDGLFLISIYSSSIYVPEIIFESSMDIRISELPSWSSGLTGLDIGYYYI